MSSKLLKLIIAGNGGVGKTTITNRYISGKFINNLDMTIGVQFFTKNLVINDQNILLQIWDFAGGDRFRTMLKQYMNGAHGVLLIYSIDNLESIQDFEEWFEILTSADMNIPIMIVGNKKDLNEYREISKDKGKELSKQFDCCDNNIEISAKTGENVEKCFNIITNKILNRKNQPLVNL